MYNEDEELEPNEEWGMGVVNTTYQLSIRNSCTAKRWGISMSTNSTFRIPHSSFLPVME